MYRIAICDDEMAQTALIETAVIKSFSSLNQPIDIDIFYSSEKLIDSVQKNKDLYQIIFLDIEMVNTNGIKTAQALRQIQDDFILIFVTSYSSYMLSSFAVKPFRYILKPFVFEEFSKVMKDVCVELSNRNTFLFYQIGRDMFQIRSKNIVMITSLNGRKVQVTLLDQSTVEFYDKIKRIYNKLPNLSFIRVNSGTIINMNYIQSIIGDKILLETGDTIFISRSNRTIFKQKYSNFIESSVGI